MFSSPGSPGPPSINLYDVFAQSPSAQAQDAFSPALVALCWSEDSSTTMYTGGSRLVILCPAYTRRHTSAGPPPPNLKTCGLKCQICEAQPPPLSFSPVRRPLPNSPSTPLQAQRQTTDVDISTTGARGIPQIARCLDPYFCWSKGRYFLSPSSLATVADLLQTSDEIGFREESYGVVLPPPILEVELGHVLLMGMLSPSVPNLLILRSTVSKPIVLWGSLAILANLLVIFDGFTEITTTEAGMCTTRYLSYLKSFHLLVDSPGQSISPSSLSSISSEMRTVLPRASLTRNVSPQNTKWRCISLSITVLLSCGAVRSGPEDATNVISMIFRGADWILTSRKVTKFQVSGIAVILALTHSSLGSSLLFFYLRGFSTLNLYALLFETVRVWLSSFFNCSSNV